MTSKRGLAIMACLGAILTFSSAQIAKRRPTSQGPRAIGLLQLASNGKAHLIPVVIMVNGKFYDASVYKADPLPMALDPKTVYEGFKSGVSQGLFTVTGAGQRKDGWFGYGQWRSNADIEAEKAKAKADAEKKAQSAPPPEQQIGGPPKLKRGQDNPPKGSGGSEPKSTPAPPEPKASETKSSDKPVSINKVDESGRPVLRRQAPSETTKEQTKAEAEAEDLKGPLQSIAAVSDADGPEPRSYAYPLKPEDEPTLLKKMLAMASEEVNARAKQVSAGTEEPKTAVPRKKTPGKTEKSPEFRDVQMRVLDLSSTNEAVLVLTAQAKVPATKEDLDYMTAVVARQDIYGDLHKVFAQTTDRKHLDVLPRYEFMDAVDVNGDGRADLLFRLSTDSGSAFAIYSVIGDRLWPLFEGKPGS